MLLTLIWLRRYPTLDHLGMHFGIPVTCVHRIIHKMIPILHASTVHKYIQWHSNQEWLNLAGTIALWPNVVAILDGTPFRINRPQGKCMNAFKKLLQIWLHTKCAFYQFYVPNFFPGKYQRIFYRRDRHCFFLNWIVIIDINGVIVLSRPGYVRHLSDSTCFQFVLLHPVHLERKFGLTMTTISKFPIYMNAHDTQWKHLHSICFKHNFSDISHYHLSLLDFKLWLIKVSRIKDPYCCQLEIMEMLFVESLKSK